MKTCNRKILELFYNAKHSGRIMKPDAVGRVGEDDEGLVIELTWRVIGGVIADAKFRAFANPNAIAITSLMVDNMIGKSVEDVLSLGEDVIIDNLGEFLPEYLEVYDMVRECIGEAYNYYVKHQNRNANAEIKEFDYEEYRATHEIEEDEEFDFIKLQRELRVGGDAAEKRGRGRPRKEIDPNAEVVVGEKRGRGRPRKIVDEVEIVPIVKRGRGRPRKEIDPNVIVEVGEKRGRGRPRKPVDPNAVVEIGEKRGRGRPRKEIDPNVEVAVGEKRGRGRPRKIVDETEIVLTIKRGRGRPRKEIDPDAIVGVGEKRGRGRPRKEVDANAVVEIGEKRGRGRPRKEVKFNLPSDLDDVIGDEEVEQLINGNSQSSNMSSNSIVDDLISNNIDSNDDSFDADYDLFKSNIRNILSGKEVSNKDYRSANISETKDSTFENEAPVYEEEIKNDFKDNQVNDEIVINNDAEVKRGRGRPRKEVDVEIVVDNEEKRGRGRPKKIVIEEVADNTNSYATRVEPINSLTRSLTPNSMLSNTHQDIVFASKNVTTTNININVTKTTTSVDDAKAVSDDYSQTTNISKQTVEIVLPKKDSDYAEVEEEVEDNYFDNVDVVDEDLDEIDTSNIKDEAPTGGIEDLLKALLDN